MNELVWSTMNASAGLPLLQFTLDEIWRARDRERQVIAAHVLESVGGVEGALSRHADGVLDAMLPGVRDAARQVMLVLVTRQETRSRHDELTLTGGDDKRAAVLRALVAGRLLVVREVDGQATYEIAHEALIANCNTLRDWLSDKGSTRDTHEQLALAAVAWERADRRRDALSRGRSLRQSEELPADRLTPLEAAFLSASQRERTRGRQRRLMLLLATMAIILASLILLIGLDVR